MGDSKPFLLLAGRYHFKGLPSSHTVGKQGISSKKNTCYRIFLVRE